MEVPRCIATATINGRTIAAAYYRFEDPTLLPPGGKTWVDGELALKGTAGRLLQAGTKATEGEEKAAS